jgi:hypothetical protein
MLRCEEKSLESYLPGLEAGGTPLLLDEGHVSLEVVVHLEVGTLLVDDFTRLLSVLGSSSLGFMRLYCLTGGGCGHVGGL